MRTSVSNILPLSCKPLSITDNHVLQEPDMQKVTGKTNPVDVMHALREMKNNFK